MATSPVNRISGIVLALLSVTALLTVCAGYTRPPLPDEGALAHIFQLTIVAVVPAMLVFLTTADWTQPLATARRLAVPIIALVLAFAALYYLEHHFYPAHYALPVRPL
jgi:hypothetical protein